MTDEYQTTFDAEVFGQELQRRVAAARDVQQRAVALFTALNQQRAGEWQPAAIDQAIHYATRAVQRADGSAHRSYLELAEEAVAAAEQQYPDAAAHAAADWSRPADQPGATSGTPAEGGQ